MRSRARWLLCLSLIGGLSSSAKATELSGSELEVFRKPGASDCPDSTELSRSVAALGTALTQPSQRLRIEVTFERDADAYSGTINSFGSKPGVRRLAMSGKTCESLAEAVSVTLAVLLDLLPSPDKRATEPQGSSAPAPENPGAPFVLDLALHGGIAYGELGPVFTGVVSPALRLSRERFQLLGSAFWNTPDSSDFRTGFVRVGLWGGALEACFRLGSRDRARLGWTPCAGLRLGQLSGKGLQFDQNYEATQTWAALSASSSARVPLTRKWGLIAGLSAIVPLRKHTFSVAGAGRAFESEPVAVLLELGPEVQIW